VEFLRGIQDYAFSESTTCRIQKLKMGLDEVPFDGFWWCEKFEEAVTKYRDSLFERFKSQSGVPSFWINSAFGK
jgi:hypothetical protein